MSKFARACNDFLLEYVGQVHGHVPEEESSLLHYYLLALSPILTGSTIFIYTCKEV